MCQRESPRYQYWRRPTEVKSSHGTEDGPNDERDDYQKRLLSTMSSRIIHTSLQAEK